MYCVGRAVSSRLRTHHTSEVAPPVLPSWQGTLHGAALSFRDGSRAVEQARKPQKPTSCCETMADARHQRVLF